MVPQSAKLPYQATSGYLGQISRSPYPHIPHRRTGLFAHFAHPQGGAEKWHNWLSQAKSGEMAALNLAKITISLSNDSIFVCGG